MSQTCDTYQIFTSIKTHTSNRINRCWKYNASQTTTTAETLKTQRLYGTWNNDFRETTTLTKTIICKFCNIRWYFYIIKSLTTFETTLPYG